MKLLLDTHTFIWWDSEPAKLSSKALALCQDRANTVLLSVASIWEIQIKLQLGKLKLNLSLVEVIESQQQANNIEVLPITLGHVLALDGLPAHHKDPLYWSAVIRYLPSILSNWFGSLTLNGLASQSYWPSYGCHKPCFRPTPNAVGLLPRM